MATDVQKLQREAQVEEAKWRFFTVYRYQLADCTANELRLEEALEVRNLPISYDNLVAVWESLTPQERVTFAQPVGVNAAAVKQRKASATAAAEAKAAEERAAVLPEGVLPREWDKARLQKCDREEYRKLIKQYGMAAIDDRLAGRS